MTTFNRTSMELKPVLAARPYWQYIAFNRTSMELKHGLGGDTGTPSVLLIGPVWN